MAKDYEKMGLKISMAGSLLLSVSAIIIAIIAKSQAVLLDGVYTFIALSMSFLSLKVINKVNTPESSDKPFGFMAMEPFLNLVKSIIILILLAVFLITNIQELLTGGRIISIDLISLYIFICLIIYLIILLYLNKCRKQTESSILMLEIRIWRIDALLTLGIAVSLAIAYVLLKLGYTRILPYIDPVIVIILVIASIPVPVKEVFNELKKLLLISGENDIEKEVKEQINPVIKKYGLINVHVWALNSGRTNYIFLYLDLEDEHVSLSLLDEIRSAIFSELSRIYPKFWADIMFTRVNPNGDFPLKQNS